MADFGCIRPFHIDNGELDGESPQQCFVLGYELAQIDMMLERPEPIVRPVHAQNKERIVEALKNSGREYRLTWAAGDVSESWMMLAVLPMPSV